VNLAKKGNLGHCLELGGGFRTLIYEPLRPDNSFFQNVGIFAVNRMALPCLTNAQHTAAEINFLAAFDRGASLNLAKGIEMTTTVLRVGLGDDESEIAQRRQMLQRRIETTARGAGLHFFFVSSIPIERSTSGVIS
jgi:hypothetical protein